MGSGRTKAAVALTARTIDALKPEANVYRMPDLRCPGLAIRLEAGRARANALTSAARQGRDLIAEEKNQRDEDARALSLADLIGRYLATEVTGRLKTATETARMLHRAFESRR
jgi:hypothetical protein